MHYLLLVTCNKDEAKTSEEARSHVQSELEQDSSFCGEGGRFSSPIADWFVIGGRWSGELTTRLLDQKKLKKFWKEFEEKKLGWTNLTDKKEEDQKKKTHELFMKFFPDFKGMIPVYRDQYEHNGFEDDAMIVTEEIYNKILKQHEGEYKGATEKEVDNYKWEELHYFDLEQEEVNKDFIGKKWLVVVDYHS